MTVIIPAYKPNEQLISLIRDLRQKSDVRILVVNDGSPKEYDRIFSQLNETDCTLLVHEVNRGKGAAMKTAFSYLLSEKNPSEIICTADADGQHLPDDILRCLDEAKKNPSSFVLGVRAFDGNVPARSRFGNQVSRITFRCLMGIDVVDTQTGLRAFSGAFLEELLAIEGDRYEYEMKVLCTFAKKKIPLLQVGIKTVYLDDNRSSHFSPLKDSLKVYGLLLRCTFGPFFQILSFLFSSGFAFVVDLVSYAILFHLLFPPFFTTLRSLEFCSLLVARILSSAVNYLINQRVVFQNAKNPLKTTFLYALLSVGTFFVHEGLNALFLVRFSFAPLLALLLAQVIFFPISFLVQKYVIFAKKEEK